MRQRSLIFPAECRETRRKVLLVQAESESPFCLLMDIVQDTFRGNRLNRTNSTDTLAQVGIANLCSIQIVPSDTAPRISDEGQMRRPTTTNTFCPADMIELENMTT